MKFCEIAHFRYESLIPNFVRCWVTNSLLSKWSVKLVGLAKLATPIECRSTRGATGWPATHANIANVVSDLNKFGL
jgi:hypothetical protein